jgi:hypothetical protein
MSQSEKNPPVPLHLRGSEKAGLMKVDEIRPELFTQNIPSTMQEGAG